MLHNFIGTTSPNAHNGTTVNTAYEMSTHHELRNSRFTFIKLPDEDENEERIRKSNSVGHISVPMIGQSLMQPNNLTQEQTIPEEVTYRKGMFERTPNFKVNQVPVWLNQT